MEDAVGTAREVLHPGYEPVVGLLVGVLVEAGERLVERPAFDGQCQELAALSSPVRCLEFLHGAVVAAADKRCKRYDNVDFTSGANMMKMLTLQTVQT